VHPVLDLQPGGLDPQQAQPLKHGLAEPCLCCLLAHDHRAQLAVVPNKDDLRSGGKEGGYELREKGLNTLLLRLFGDVQQVGPPPMCTTMAPGIEEYHSSSSSTGNMCLVLVKALARG
jgi:hypothetical protein